MGLNLVTDEKDRPKPNLANATAILRGHSAVTGMLWRDEFSMRTMMRAMPPWHSTGAFSDRPWSDMDDTRLTVWMQEIGLSVTVETVGRAVEIVADDQRYHPVVEWLDRLTWDSKSRIDTWLIDFCGVEDVHYARAVAAKWMIGAVARVFQPGAKVDTMLILEGAQGLRKSTALKTLAGDEWFTDSLPDLSSKDAAIQTVGKWIIEIAELDTMNRSETTTIKAYMSRATDTYRPP
jgi:putative DNA primase/helicase